ncbi:MAG TPA: hypothetical protein VI461_05600, partial [Chitinophagaceae bacterium]|nr:hypothetical protein [Chitinophagaceae bacterium]
TRVNFLNQNPDFGFAGGLIETFPVKTVILKPAANDPQKEILFFEKNCGTAPSTYMFRKKILLEHEIRFNTKLNSTADRFFILQVAMFAKGRRIEDENGKLLYRVHEQSMSHNMTPGLILDNERFYKELVKGKMLPGTNTAKFKSQYFYSLGLGFAKVKHFKSFIKYFWHSFLSSPLYFMKRVFIKKTFSE